MEFNVVLYSIGFFILYFLLDFLLNKMQLKKKLYKKNFNFCIRAFLVIVFFVLMLILNYIISKLPIPQYISDSLYGATAAILCISCKYAV